MFRQGRWACLGKGSWKVQARLGRLSVEGGCAILAQDLFVAYSRSK